jgi:hypothetical protein
MDDALLTLLAMRALRSRAIRPRCRNASPSHRLLLGAVSDRGHRGARAGPLVEARLQPTVDETGQIAMKARLDVLQVMYPSRSSHRSDRQARDGG